MRRAFSVLFFVLLSTSVCYGQRGVQISSITFIEDDVVLDSIELTNFGSTTEDMSNWRFCSHDDNQQRIYSSGIGGTLAPGDSVSLFAPSFSLALPFTPDQAYSLAIFDLDAGGFGGTSNIVDHLQWSPAGVDSPNARFRSGQAVSAGVWTGTSDWIATDFDTGKIVLKDTTGGILHGPDDYEVVRSGGGVSCDLDRDGDCDIDDIDFLVSIGTTPDEINSWLLGASTLGVGTFVAGDLNLDGTVDSTDLGSLLNNFGDATTLGYSRGNVNGDANVDSTDLGRLLNNFGFAQAAQSASSASLVPEPDFGSILLPIFLAAMTFFRRSL